MSTSSAPPTTNKSLLFIVITVFIDVMGLGIIMPIVPDLIEELTGQAANEASFTGGLLMFSYAIMQFTFSPILGGLSDRFGRRPVLLISLAGLGIDYVFNALAPTLSLLFVGRMIAGLCGASFTTASAYIADVSAPEKRAQNFGFIGVAFGLGFIAGPVLGGVIGEYGGTRAPFWVAAGLSFVNFLYGLFILPESLPKESRRKFDIKRSNPLGSLMNLRKFPVLAELIGSLVLIYLAAHAVQSTWNFYTKHLFEWSKLDIGISLAVVGVLVAAVQGGLIRVIVPKLGQQKAIFLGFSLYGLGLLLFGLANHGWMMYVFLIPYCLGGIAGPTLQGLISSQVPINEQGELQGTLTSMMSVTMIIGPLMMNGLFSYFSKDTSPVYIPGAAFYAGALLTLVSTLLLIKPLRRLAMAEAAKKEE